MLPSFVIAALLAGLAIVVLLYFGAGALAQHRWGRLALLIGIVALPLLVSAGGVSSGVRESSRTSFCLSCHEMQRYGMSLFADNRTALAAAHYQNRLVARDSTCYSCHADYALFGDVKAKLNGLRHVWVHYFKKVPEKISLYGGAGMNRLDASPWLAVCKMDASQPVIDHPECRRVSFMREHLATTVGQR